MGYTQLLINFVFFQAISNTHLISSSIFVLYIISLLSIMAAGYVYNDFKDFKTDVVNKPKKLIVTTLFTIENTQIIYKILNTIGILFGVLLALQLKKPSVALIFIGAALLLYFYSKKLKQLPLIGNIAISFLISFSILVPLFLIPEQAIYISDSVFELFILGVLAFFAFFINLVREIVKDVQDIKGDYMLNMNTLPIIIGRKRTLKIASFLSLFLSIALMFIIYKYVLIYKAASFYLIGTCMLPLLYISYKLPIARTNSDFRFYSNLLKVIMFLGINSLILLPLSF
ncbi:UbiA family prenyltransferase [Lutibacter sp.]|uniref:UbiA family prenyltransferase n=1 Tax=Lutibacter sp. TaxID=1925666 RepID=UPI0027330638|nr:UbiA family prenyltransferase [Lutibacter sp.]MDP3313222.1 UbiA family prenyltransferase [Lutibacter sp.]